MFLKGAGAFWGIPDAIDLIRLMILDMFILTIPKGRAPFGEIQIQCLF